MENCIFCKIANREIKSTFVYEDENTVAFNDLSPVAPTHILVIPKKHYSSINEVDDKKVFADLYNAVQKITQKLGIKNFRTVINTGEEAGQSVLHLHLHILAGRTMEWPPG